MDFNTRKITHFKRETSDSIPCNIGKNFLQDHTKLKHLHRNKILKRDDDKYEIEQYVKEYKKKDFHGEWHTQIEKKLMVIKAQHRFENAFKERSDWLDKRRDRLRQLYEYEQNKHLHEIEQQGETPEECKTRMFTSLQILRNQKEKERVKFVKEKLDQQWSENCDELNSLISKLICKEISNERKEQVIMKNEIEKQRKEEELMFFSSWQKDAEMKSEKIRFEKEDRKKKNIENALLIKQQCEEALKKKRLEKLDKEEVELMKKQRELMKLEKLWDHKKKLKLQDKVQQTLDKCLMIKNKFIQNEKEEEDLLNKYCINFGKILDDKCKITTKEMDKKMKEQLHEDQLQYFAYLAKELEDEKKRGIEIEKFIKTENDKIWNEREKVWAVEREARNKLMWESYDAIVASIKQKLDSINDRRAEIMKEGIEIDKRIKEYNREEAEKMKKLKDTRSLYRKDLLDLIEERKRKKEEEKTESRREWEASKRAEEDYADRMKRAVDRPTIRAKLHPGRGGRFRIPVSEL